MIAYDNDEPVNGDDRMARRLDAIALAALHVDKIKDPTAKRLTLQALREAVKSLQPPKPESAPLLSIFEGGKSKVFSAE